MQDISKEPQNPAMRTILSNSTRELQSWNGRSEIGKQQDEQKGDGKRGISEERMHTFTELIMQ